MYAIVNGAVCKLTLPSADDYVLPGVRWGAFDELLTAAYWRGQAWQQNALGMYRNHRFGDSLREELAACLLGGYGMPAELGLLAYARLRERGLLEGKPQASSIEKSLKEPFEINNRVWHYRFPHQKARYLSECLGAVDNFVEPASDIGLRDALAQFPGIGLKTASWIVKNYRSSNQVAIIDTHILRAGRHLALFPPEWEPQRDYKRLEERFLCFASAIGVCASFLDGLIWDYMRQIPDRLVSSRPAAFSRGSSFGKRNRNQQRQSTQSRRCRMESEYGAPNGHNKISI